MEPEKKYEYDKIRRNNKIPTEANEVAIKK